MRESGDNTVAGSASRMPNCGAALRHADLSGSA
jgi:hypothetical protein